MSRINLLKYERGAKGQLLRSESRVMCDFSVRLSNSTPLGNIFEDRGFSSNDNISSRERNIFF